MSGGFVLPRIRVRSRRRKPCGPEWRRTFLWLCFFLAWGVVCFLTGHLVSASAMWLGAYSHLRELRWFPADPEGPVPTPAQRSSTIVISAGVVALAITGLFA